MEEKITLDMLTKEHVSVLRQNILINNGIEYIIGDNHRCAYENTPTSVEDLKKDIPEPYLSTILNLWGVTQ